MHPTKICIRGNATSFTYSYYAYIIGRRLPDEVVYRIRLRIDTGTEVAAISKAVGVSKKTIYKLRLNLDIWGKPYALATIILGRPRALLLYLEQVIYNII